MMVAGADEGGSPTLVSFICLNIGIGGSRAESCNFGWLGSTCRILAFLISLGVSIFQHFRRGVLLFIGIQSTYSRG